MTTHLPKLCGTFQQAYDTSCSLKHLWITLVVVKSYSRLARHHPVQPRTAQEPEEGRELYDDVEDGEGYLKETGDKRRSELCAKRQEHQWHYGYKENPEPGSLQEATKLVHANIDGPI